jgi:hypothetical protein
MQIENNYDRDVFNGDIGFVTGIDPTKRSSRRGLRWPGGHYPFGELDELVLCYATTIHKSQGSEYPVVVIPISTQHYMMLKRNLIYTGITRGKSAGRAGRPEESAGHGGQGQAGGTALVETERTSRVSETSIPKSTSFCSTSFVNSLLAA